MGDIFPQVSSKSSANCWSTIAPCLTDILALLPFEDRLKFRCTNSLWAKAAETNRSWEHVDARWVPLSIKQEQKTEQRTEQNDDINDSRVSGGVGLCNRKLSWIRHLSLSVTGEEEMMNIFSRLRSSAVSLETLEIHQIDCLGVPAHPSSTIGIPSSVRIYMSESEIANNSNTKNNKQQHGLSRLTRLVVDARITMAALEILCEQVPESLREIVISRAVVPSRKRGGQRAVWNTIQKMIANLPDNVIELLCVELSPNFEDLQEAEHQSNSEDDPLKEYCDDLVSLLAAKQSKSLRCIVGSDMCVSHQVFQQFRNKCVKVETWDLPGWRYLY